MITKLREWSQCEVAVDFLGEFLLSAFLYKQLAEQTTLFSDPLRQRTCVDAVYGGYVVFLEPGAQGGFRQEMRVVFTRVRGGDKAGYVDFRGFEVGGQVVKECVARCAGGYAVVARERKGADKDLAAVGGVGERLGVAGHASLEDQLASSAAFCTVAKTLADVAIF